MTIRIQMPLGTSSVSVGGESFVADENGVVTVAINEQVAPLIAAGGVEIGEDGVPVSGGSFLVGSSTLPSSIAIIDGQEPVQLGTLVSAAHEWSGVTVDEWNNLPAVLRDRLIGLEAKRIHDNWLDSGPVDADDDADAKLNASTDSSMTATKPDFVKMTKAELSQWVVGSGAEAIPAGSHDAHVAAAEARYLELNPAA